ncbi:hypothetical protein JCM24511_08921 [Saitozyma sp. JCM 24511]|nr:hypothetical protein JCM24511_08921 [Saitozyma sp. JCM 24511]
MYRARVTIVAVGEWESRSSGVLEALLANPGQPDPVRWHRAVMIGNELNDLRSRLTQLENLIASGSHSASPTPTNNSAPISVSPTDLLVAPNTTTAPSDIQTSVDIFPGFPEFLSEPTAPNDFFPVTGPPSSSSAGQKRQFSETGLVDATQTGEHIARMERAGRLKRGRDGRLVHFGPISIWSQLSGDVNPGSHSAPPAPVRPTSWASSLPPGLPIDQATHDLALERFAAYYAPWCMVADMPGFRADLDSLCKDPSASWRTTTYSPLLHCTALFIGLCLLHRNEWSSPQDTWNLLFQDHCVRLLHRECANMTISTLWATNLMSSCMHFDSEVGYLYFGMTVAAVQTLGLIVNSGSYVKRGQMTPAEHTARDTALWTVYLQDVLRAIGVGRSAMLPDSYGAVLPQIIPSVDAEPWLLPSDRAASANPSVLRLAGLPSTRSTVLHWTARLGVILRAVIDSLYSAKSDENRRSAPPPSLVRRLDSWRKQMPLSDPTARPLPHILMMHLLYNLVCIYLHRPFYRTAMPAAAPSAARCNRAAGTILNLLKLYDELHGVENAPMTLIQITFGAASVFLLNEVGDSTGIANGKNNLNRIDDCIDMMRRQVETWKTPDNALEALLHLRSEWLPIVENQVDARGVSTTDNLDILDQLPFMDFNDLFAFDLRSFGGIAMP